MRDKTALLSLPYEKALPTGLTSWAAPDRVCGRQAGERTLFFTACSTSQYACYDGSCVDILQEHSCHFPDSSNSEGY